MEMPSGDGLTLPMDVAVKHYASLFKLPSYKKVVFLQALVCTGSGLLPILILFQRSGRIATGSGLSIVLFLVSMFSDYALRKSVLREDPIYDLRRTTTLSVFCWGLWFLFIFAGALFGIMSGFVWWVRLTLLGFSAVMMLRLIVLSPSTSIKRSRLLAASFLPPFLCLLPFLSFWVYAGYAVTVNLALFLVSAVVLTYLSVSLFLSLLDREGKQMLNIPSLDFWEFI